MVRELPVPQGWDTSKTGVSPAAVAALKAPLLRLLKAGNHSASASLSPTISQLSLVALSSDLITSFLPMCCIHVSALHPCLAIVQLPTQDCDHVALLARETVEGGHSVLIFCGTKKACESTARRAAR